MNYPAGFDYAPYVPYPVAPEPPHGARLPRCEILRVSGRRGAEALALAPASSALALDETAPLVWCIQTDSAGVKTLTPYSIALYTEPVPVSMDELSARLQRLEEMLRDQPDPEPVKPTAKQRRADSADA